MTSHRSAATARGLKLVSYEGGQHLVGFFGAENDNALTNLLIAANRDTRIGAAYTKYLNESWKAGGGELFVHFDSCSSYTKFGSWGAVERLDLQSTPKQNALLGFLGGSGPCVTDATTLCLVSSRFRLRVSWSSPYDGSSGVGTAVPLTSDTGYFWFFNDSNVELIVKVLDGRAVNGNFWVFCGALSDVEYDITITDTQASASKTYHNAPRTLASVADTGAF